jgi:hypothetical protein
MTDHRTLNPQPCERHAKLGIFEPCCDDCYKAEAAREAPADAPPATLRAADWKAEADELVSEVRRSEVLTGKDRSTHFGQPAAEPPAPPAQVLTAEQDAILGGEEYRDILRRERDEARAEVARLQEELAESNVKRSILLQQNAAFRLQLQNLDHEIKRTAKLEAEAQALRAGLTEALEHYGNLAYSELKPSPYYDREEAKITRLSALLSPAQEQK